MYDTPVAKQPPRNTWTVVLAGLGAFMSALDLVVVSTALPTLQSHLGASLADLEWTINAYSLVFGALMLTGAALGDRFGRRRMYVLGLLTFAVGSAVAALSSGAGMLILVWMAMPMVVARCGMPPDDQTATMNVPIP